MSRRGERAARELCFVLMNEQNIFSVTRNRKRHDGLGIAKVYRSRLKQWIRASGCQFLKIPQKSGLQRFATTSSARDWPAQKKVAQHMAGQRHGQRSITDHFRVQFILRASRVRAPSECRDCDRPPFLFSIGTLKLRNATKENRRSSELLLKKPSAFGVQCRQVGRFAVSAHFVRWLKRH